MKLAPPIAAGRTNRRARAFSAEIAQLHHEGYSYAAIQRALADVGISVCKTTVRREVVRALQRSAPAQALVPPRTPPPKHATESGGLPRHVNRPTPALDKRGTAKEIAEAFVKSQITNSLFRNRS